MADDRQDAPPVQTLGEIGLRNFSPYLMNRIMGRYNDNLRLALRDVGLTTVKMRILAVLSVVQNLTINELAIYVVTEQSTMSRTLEAMEQAGLLERSRRADDARVREIVLTDAGRAEFDRVWPKMHACFEDMFDGIPPEERDAFVATLRAVLKNIRRHEI